MADDLDKYSEITNLHFNIDNPHMAVCHYTQGYSANERPDALMFKSGLNNSTLNKEIIKSLSSIYEEVNITKMTYENLRVALESAIQAALKETFPSHDDCWSWVQDFNDDLAVFRFDGNSYAVTYSVGDGDVIMLGDTLRQTNAKTIYVDTSNGEQLMKAAQWIETIKDAESEKLLKQATVLDQIKNPDNGVNTGDVPIATPQALNKDKEGNMSELLTMTQDELDEKLTKAAADNEIAITKAAELKVAEILKAREFDELTKNTVELLKGVEAVGEEAANLTKSILATDAADLIVKALTDMQDLVTAARAEVETVKAKFGEQTAEEGQPAASQQGIDKAKLQAYVAQRKAATKA